MPTPEEFAEQRRINKIRYAIEDYADSFKDLLKPSLTHLVFAVVLLLSALVAGADNYAHAFVCLLTGAGLGAATNLKTLETSPLALVTGGYVVLLVIECLLFGLPDLLVPQLNANEWRGFPIFVNHAIPFVYLGVRILLVYFVVSPWVFRARVLRQEDIQLEKLLREAGL